MVSRNTGRAVSRPLHAVLSSHLVTPPTCAGRVRPGRGDSAAKQAVAKTIRWRSPSHARCRV